MSEEYKELSKEDFELVKERIEDNERCIIAIQKTSKDTDEDIEYYQKEVEALKNLINGYLMEKARADKLTKLLGKALTKIEKLGGNADAII